MGSRLAVLAALFAVAGCSAEATSREERVGHTSSAIIDGTVSGAEQDFVVQLGLDTDGVIAADCTSSLVAENLILTARHCVGDVDPETKDRMLNTYDPDRLVVFTGSDGPQKLEAQETPAARGRKVLVPSGDSLFPDLAFIVLDQPVKAPIARLRLNAGAKKSERVTVVGFGMNENNQNVAVRMQREAVQILALAPGVTEFHQLHAGEFAFGEAACFGDSGGPALSPTTGAIVGVASRVNSGVASTSTRPNAICIDAEDVYTSLQPFQKLVDAAFTAAGAEPLLEAASDDETPASSTKKPVSATVSQDDDHVAQNPQASAGGCSSSSSGASSPLGALALAFAASLFVRRQRSARHVKTS